MQRAVKGRRLPSPVERRTSAQMSPAWENTPDRNSPSGRHIYLFVNLLTEVVTAETLSNEESDLLQSLATDYMAPTWLAHRRGYIGSTPTRAYHLIFFAGSFWHNYSRNNININYSHSHPL